MSIQAAIQAVAASRTVAATAITAWESESDLLTHLGANNPMRIAAVLGQCAHESGGYLHRFENLNYSTAALKRVFKHHFQAHEYSAYAGQPEKIANRVYANRMSNGSEASGDGWRYRGRGYLQLTGKDNYITFGNAIGKDLVGQPELAADPETAWLVAVRYLASRRRSGKTLMEWADEGNDRMVSIGINGSTNPHGLSDRIARTARALAGLNGSVSTGDWQFLLLSNGFEPGPIDGLDGPKTRAAIAAAEEKFGKSGQDLANHLRALI